MLDQLSCVDGYICFDTNTCSMLEVDHDIHLTYSIVILWDANHSVKVAHIVTHDLRVFTFYFSVRSSACLFSYDHTNLEFHI